MANPIEKSITDVDNIIEKSKDVAKGKSLAAAGIEPAWLTAYAEIARRTRDNKEFGLSRHPYEPGPSVSAFSGGFFEHRQWPLRVDLEKQSSMKPVAMHEANYINSAGYWLAFHESAAELRHEAAAANDQDKMSKFDVWMLLSVRYALRVTGLRAEFYKMAADDPVTAKMLQPGLERRSDMPASDDLDEALEKLQGHMSTQLMKAVAAMKASNSGKRAGGGIGGTADGN